MERWNSSTRRSRDPRRYFVRNRTRTLIEISKRVSVSLEDLLVKLQDIGFPLDYVSELKRIKFTVLSRQILGYYVDGEIMINAPLCGSESLLTTLVHEVGHFLDDQEELSRDLTDERKRCHKYLRDKSARFDNFEYFAVGFERFYSLDREQRRTLRKRNPKLYRAILSVHKRHRSKQ